MTRVSASFTLYTARYTAKTYPALPRRRSGELASNWIYDGRANFIMDNLLAEKKAVPMLIVIPNNQVVHRNHPKHVELTFKLFEADLRQHVIPLVEREYSVRREPKGRALSGLSMGGRHTMFVGFNSLDLFASFGVLSAGDVDCEKSLAKFLNDPDVNKKIDYLFVGQGALEAEGRMGERCVALHKALENHKIQHNTTWRHARHDWPPGDISLHHFLQPVRRTSLKCPTSQFVGILSRPTHVARPKCRSDNNLT